MSLKLLIKIYYFDDVMIANLFKQIIENIATRQ